MPLSNGKIRDKQYNDSHALCNDVNEILPLFPCFSFSLDKIQWKRLTQYWHIHCEFHKNGNCLRGQTNWYPFFYASVRLGFNLEYEICTSCCSEIVSFVKIGEENPTIFLITLYRKTVWRFSRKKFLDTVHMQRHKLQVHHLHSCCSVRWEIRFHTHTHTVLYKISNITILYTYIRLRILS